MRASICMCMPTKPPMVIYTSTCAAKSHGANATCADVSDAGKSRTAAQSARGQGSLKIAIKWVTGRAIPSLVRLTNKPS